jgi:hypothetical protein
VLCFETSSEEKIAAMVNNIRKESVKIKEERRRTRKW